MKPLRKKAVPELLDPRVCVSVLMPVYNTEPYLAEALESILAQTFRNYEFIIVNDGSTDGSLGILKDFAARDCRIRLIDRPHMGIVAALNEGLAEARGTFIARMDGDDVAMPKRFARQVRFFNQHPEIVALGCRCLTVDEDDDPFTILGLGATHEEIEATLLEALGSSIVHSSAMFRRNAMVALGGYRAGFGLAEDLDLYLRLAEIGRLANLPDVMMKVRRWPESSTALATAEAHFQAKQRIVNEALRRRGIHDRPYSVEQFNGYNSLVDLHRYKTGTALAFGYRATARKYAWHALRLAPWQVTSWSLLTRVYLGHHLVERIKSLARRPSTILELQSRTLDTRNTMSRILFVGEEPVRSAPSRMLADELGRLGFECYFARAFWSVAATATWLREVRQARDVVVTMYSPPSVPLLYKLAMAVAMGRPILRWWVGTDVLNCLQEKSPRWRTRLLDHLVSVNIAVAPHLVDELSSVGIKARFIPIILDNESGWGLDRPCDAPKRSLLVYLPSERHTFFRRDIIRRAIEENEDIEFVVVADDEHSLSDLPNVRSLGWVENMQTVWPQVGGLLRITKHDGLPRMVLECLLRGKYAIYSWPLPGCWLARTFDEVQEKIDRFRNVTTANNSGIQAARRICTPDPSEAFANVIENTDQTGVLLRRLCGIGATPPLVVLIACQKLFGGFSTNP